MTNRGNANRTWRAWGDHPVIVGIIVVAAIAGLFLAAWPYINKETSVEFIGRVVDSRSQTPISNAKVSIFLRDSSITDFTDSEGEYRFTISMSTESLSIRIQVDAKDHNSYQRNTTIVSNLTRIADIRLDPTDTATSPTPNHKSL